MEIVGGEGPGWVGNMTMSGGPIKIAGGTGFGGAVGGDVSLSGGAGSMSGSVHVLGRVFDVRWLGGIDQTLLTVS